MEQVNYVTRILDFLENYKDSYGYKYRLIAEAIGELGITKLQINVEDLEKYDPELAKLYKEKHLPQLDSVVEWFVKTRAVLSDGLGGATLKNENGKEIVTMASDFVEEIIRQMGEKVSIKELADILGCTLKLTL